MNEAQFSKNTVLGKYSHIIPHFDKIPISIDIYALSHSHIKFLISMGTSTPFDELFQKIPISGKKNSVKLLDYHLTFLSKDEGYIEKGRPNFNHRLFLQAVII